MDKKMASELLIEGRNTVCDILRVGKGIERLFLSNSNQPDKIIGEIKDLAKLKHVPITFMSAKEMDRLTNSTSHQGVAASLLLPEAPTLKQIYQTNPNAVVLVFGQIDYEQNLGAIIRSSWAAGVDAIVVSPSGVNRLSPLVAKVSMGGAAFVPVIFSSLFPQLKTLQDLAVPIVGVEVAMGKSFVDTKLTGPIALIFGSEANDITQAVQKYCESFIHIPMLNHAASLNISVATALVIFERLRQQRLG